MDREARDLARTIVEAYGGRVMFNISQAAKITGRGRNTLPFWLHKHGVQVEYTGRNKLVNANDLAVCMLADRKSPIE